METIYDYITKKKIEYASPIELADGWSWSMKDHLRRSFLYLNSQFDENNDDRELRPNKNIVLGIMNVHFRTEGFDVKDITLFVNDIKKNYKSFLVKKYHDRWAPENEIDTYIDELVESYCVYGGALTQKKEDSRPSVVDLRSLAFCSQRNILAHPFGIVHTMGAKELRSMKKWGLGEYGATMDVETLIEKMRKEEKTEIEVYEVHGSMPVEWLNDMEKFKYESEKDIPQVQIVTFYKDENNTDQGVTLFRHKEPVLPFKFLSRDKVFGRALGRGGVEELFEPQAWTGWNESKVTEMLESASKIIPVTDDPSIASKHPSGMKDMDNLEFLQVGEGKKVEVFNNVPRNLDAFNAALERWERHSQTLGSATEPLLGESPSAGTPFALFERQTIEAKGMHVYRQGKIATFMDEIYRDWIIPHIQREIVKGDQFLSELSADEMQSISDAVVTNRVNKVVAEKILDGRIVSVEEVDAMTQMERERFFRSNKKFIEILKDEITDSLDVMTNIAGKQKNLAMMTDKLVNVLRQYLATPQIRQDPAMNQLLNTILESSGLSPIMFNPSVPSLAQPAPQEAGQPLQQFAKVPA